MYFKKETHLSAHYSNVSSKNNQCLSMLLYFIINTHSNYLSKLFKLVKINFEIKTQVFSHLFM